MELLRILVGRCVDQGVCDYCEWLLRAAMKSDEKCSSLKTLNEEGGFVPAGGLVESGQARPLRCW